MKFIDSSLVKGNLIDAVTTLKAKGILASSTDDYANIPGKTHLARNIKVSIWIHVNHQYNDAIAILRNPHHQPATGLTEEEMEEVQQGAKNQLGNFAEEMFIKLITILLATGLIALIFYVAINII